MVQQRIDDPAAVQMASNFRAVARYRLLDSYGLTVLLARKDRVFCTVPPESEAGLLRRFDQLELAGDFVGANASLHSVPAELLGEGIRAAKIRAFRARLPGGLHGDQWIVYRLLEGSRVLGLIVEMDIDKESPIDGVGLIPHLWMVVKHKLWGGKADPKKAAERLRAGGIEV